ISELSECLDLDGLSPEDRGGVAVDLGQEIVDVRRWLELVVAVEAEIAVAPVQRPRLGGLRVAEPGDGESCPFRADALAPRWPALDDRQLPGANVVLDTDLVPGMRGDAFFAPAADAGYVQLGQLGHRDQSSCRRRLMSAAEAIQAPAEACCQATAT